MWAENVQDRTGLYGTTPVSYTHLDVYKRQENPTQPEREVEVMVGDHPSKPTQKEDLSTQETFRILMEGNNKINHVEEKEKVRIQELYKITTEDCAKNKQGNVRTLGLSLIHI